MLSVVIPMPFIKLTILIVDGLGGIGMKVKDMMLEEAHHYSERA